MPPCRSERPVPRLSRRMRRENEASRSRNAAWRGSSQSNSRWLVNPGTRTRSNGPVARHLVGDGDVAALRVANRASHAAIVAQVSPRAGASRRLSLARAVFESEGRISGRSASDGPRRSYVVNSCAATSRFVCPWATSAATRRSALVSSRSRRGRGLARRSSFSARSRQSGAPSSLRISIADASESAARRRCPARRLAAPATSSDRARSSGKPISANAAAACSAAAAASSDLLVGEENQRATPQSRRRRPAVLERCRLLLELLEYTLRLVEPADRDERFDHVREHRKPTGLRHAERLEGLRKPAELLAAAAGSPETRAMWPSAQRSFSTFTSS